MNDGVRFHPQVPQDLADAVSWYEVVSLELANRFRANVRDAIAKVRSQPLTYGIVFDDVRVVRVARFPFLVQFRVGANVLFVLGVFHTASDPEKWRMRARKTAR